VYERLILYFKRRSREEAANRRKRKSPQLLFKISPHLLHRRGLPKDPWKLSFEVHVALLGPEAVDAPTFDGESKLILVSLMLAEPV
jgi:hypothetical protein